MRFVGIDPSTKTGFVELDESGVVLQSREIHLKNGIKSTDAELWHYGKTIVSFVPPGSLVSVEGFSFGSQGKGVSTQYGVGFAIRYALQDAGLTYIEPTPTQVKKFATGKGNTKKDNMTIPILRNWNFEHPSDNVRDAFVLAQIAKALHTYNPAFLTADYHNYQLEVLQAIENPVAKKSKKKVAK